jgi:WD40 repeat protein
VGVSGEAIQLWDVSSGAEIRKVDKDIKAIAALSPDGKTLAFGFNNGKIKLQDLSTAGELRTINSGNTQVDLLLFSPDGKFLASTSGRFVKLWDLDSGKVLRNWGAQKLVTALAFSPDSKTLATGEADTKYLKQGRGNLFGGGEVELWDVANDTEHRSLGQRTNPVLGVAFSPDGKTLAIGESNVGLLLPPGLFLKDISVKNIYSYVLWFGDLRDYSVKNLNSLVLWDVTSGTEIRTLGEHPGPINSLFFSPDGKTLLSSSMDGTINLWGMPAGKELRTLKLTAWRSCLRMAP